MQHFPINRDSERAAHRRTRGEEVSRETEEHRDEDEGDATTAWLDHIAAGRVQIR